MFINIFKKTYLVNKTEVAINTTDLFIQEIKDYKNLKSEFPTLIKLYLDIYNSYNKINDDRILIINDNEFLSFINDWSNLLNLNSFSINLIINHSLFHTQYNDECQRLISNYDTFSKNFNIESIILDKPFCNKNKINKYLDFFPIEYLINYINEDWCIKKFEYFRIKELYLKIRELQLSLYNMNTNDIYLNKIFNNSSDNIIIDSISNNKKILQEIKSHILNKHYFDIKFLNLPILDYILKPNYSYNFGMSWKFNFKLLHYLYNINYKPC